jgi:hypothetical protein
MVFPFDDCFRKQDLRNKNNCFDIISFLLFTFCLGDGGGVGGVGDRVCGGGGGSRSC